MSSTTKPRFPPKNARDEDAVSDEEDDIDAEDAEVDDADADGDNEDEPVKDDEDEDDDDAVDDVDDAAEVPRKRVSDYYQKPDSTEMTIIKPENRVTSEYMTIYEYAMIVGTRATHIEDGSVLYTDPQDLSDARDIAKKEIRENRCPLSVTRKISQTEIEVWEVNEMIKPM